MEKKRVVITGMGVLTPVGNNVKDTWDAVLAGKSGIGLITQFDVTAYPTKIAGEIKNFDASEVMEKKEIRRTPGFIQYALKAAKEAVEMSGLENASINKDRVAVIVGSGIGGISVMEEQYKILTEKGPSRVSPFFIPMMIINMAGAYISMRYGYRGPNYGIVTACASGTHAFGEGAKMIIRGDADVAVVGGVESAVGPLGLAGFCSAKSLSQRNGDPTTASRPFDKDRDGFVMADGAGILVLESLEHAKARGANIIAEYAGYGASDDAYHMVAPPEDGAGGVLCMKNALADAGIKPEQVDYINAHGTSTNLNDKTESRIIREVFGAHANKVMISSTKSMTGHMLGATGAVETVMCALSCKYDVVHPTINQFTTDPECGLDYVPNVKREAVINYAASNSLGFGGHNATIIVKKYKE
ncbi:MAG: beta-ketoacyl-[acyl-carrier-protein] synthase II [Candidatus Goldiibacteriota bacterium HGW-Goldbacteria-1]|jgi:3-oxoacyl-[acyl-carrier-protein] synthase II|nr:MAG: beta-ketoacyl-[acyl-carrier-protein] synthase II [Candidatus Goldiibacteriota bacterium HGW-Goldbacteria-1]